MARRTRKQAKFASDAALQAIVRFGPEASGLKELAREAQEERTTSIAQAHGSAAAMTNEIDAARPGVAAIYDQAGLDQAKAAQSVAATDLSGLGAGANAFRAAAGIETGEAARHTAEARAATLSDLSTRRVQARAGEGFAVQAAQQKFASDIAKVLARRQDLGREQGAFTASTINSLEQSDLDRTSRETIASGHDATTKRGQNLTHADRKAAIAARKAKAKSDVTPSGKKVNPSGEHRTVRDEVGSAVASLKTLDPDRDVANWGDLGNLLQTGSQSQALKDPATGKDRLSKNGVPLKTPAVKQVGHLSARVALDLYYHGGISKDTAKMLWDAGYSLRQLGLAGKRIKSAPKVTQSPAQRAAMKIPGLGTFG